MKCAQRELFILLWDSADFSGGIAGRDIVVQMLMVDLCPQRARLIFDILRV